MYYGNLEKSLYKNTLDNLIVALCLDIERRKTAIEKNEFSPRTIMEYRYINYHIEEAANEIAGERLGAIYINEIGKKIGYAYSKIVCLSELPYKEQKREVKLNIAKKLHLFD
jgi:hypothetical protein